MFICSKQHEKSYICWDVCRWTEFDIMQRALCDSYGIVFNVITSEQHNWCGLTTLYPTPYPLSHSWSKSSSLQDFACQVHSKDYSAGNPLAPHVKPSCQYIVTFGLSTALKTACVSGCRSQGISWLLSHEQVNAGLYKIMGETFSYHCHVSCYTICKPVAVRIPSCAWGARKFGSLRCIDRWGEHFLTNVHLYGQVDAVHATCPSPLRGTGQGAQSMLLVITCGVASYGRCKLMTPCLDFI